MLKLLGSFIFIFVITIGELLSACDPITQADVRETSGDVFNVSMFDQGYPVGLCELQFATKNNLNPRNFIRIRNDGLLKINNQTFSILPAIGNLRIENYQTITSGVRKRRTRVYFNRDTFIDLKMDENGFEFSENLNFNGTNLVPNNNQNIILSYGNSEYSERRIDQVVNVYGAGSSPESPSCSVNGAQVNDYMVMSDGRTPQCEVPSIPEDVRLVAPDDYIWFQQSETQARAKLQEGTTGTTKDYSQASSNEVVQRRFDLLMSDPELSGRFAEKEAELRGNSDYSGVFENYRDDPFVIRRVVMARIYDDLRSKYKTSPELMTQAETRMYLGLKEIRVGEKQIQPLNSEERKKFNALRDHFKGEDGCDLAKGRATSLIRVAFASIDEYRRSIHYPDFEGSPTRDYPQFNIPKYAEYNSRDRFQELFSAASCNVDTSGLQIDEYRQSSLANCNGLGGQSVDLAVVAQAYGGNLPEGPFPLGSFGRVPGDEGINGDDIFGDETLYEQRPNRPILETREDNVNGQNQALSPAFAPVIATAERPIPPRRVLSPEYRDTDDYLRRPYFLPNPNPSRPRYRWASPVPAKVVNVTPEDLREATNQLLSSTNGSPLSDIDFKVVSTRGTRDLNSRNPLTAEDQEEFEAFDIRQAADSLAQVLGTSSEASSDRFPSEFLAYIGAQNGVSEIRFVTNADVLIEEDGRVTVGEYNPNDQSIEINVGFPNTPNEGAGARISPDKLKHTISHEFGHALWFKLPESLRRLYLNNIIVREPQSSDRMISVHAMEAPVEDFPEALVHFLENPEEFERRFPLRTRFLTVLKRCMYPHNNQRTQLGRPIEIEQCLIADL